MSKRNILVRLALAVLLAWLLTSCPTQQATETPAPAATPQPSQPVAVTTTLEVTYLDVGQGDATLIGNDGHYLLIDGGEKDQSSKLYTVLKNRGIDHLDYLIITHAHSDHCGGVAGALNYASVGTCYCPVTSYDSAAFENVLKYLDKQGKGITVPAEGESFSLGEASVEILGPVNAYDDPNDTSIVCRVIFGQTSFLFTGDAEDTAEHGLIYSGADLASDVLKVGHHGSSTSTGYQFLKAVAPTYAVISCGKDNPYGHPHSETLSRLRDSDTQVYRTDLQGDITCVSDGKTLLWQTTKDASNGALNPTEVNGSGQNATEPAYIGNLRSSVFHLPTCGSLPKESNRIYFDNREEAVAAGYRPCGNCKP